MVCWEVMGVEPSLTMVDDAGLGLCEDGGGLNSGGNVVLMTDAE
jgi:hypothetical protein